MLLDAGRVARRHVLDGFRRPRAVCGSIVRLFTSSSLRHDSSSLPWPLNEPLKRREDPNPAAKDIGILGGGITGLSTALWLAIEIPDARITIHEQSNRLGGWIDSEVVKVTGGEVLFEWGPRSLRPALAGNGYASYELVSTTSGCCSFTDGHRRLNKSRQITGSRSTIPISSPVKSRAKPRAIASYTIQITWSGYRVLTQQRSLHCSNSFEPLLRNLFCRASLFHS
jgi:hypothetical protein